jgi:hypothetical protein
MQKIDIKINPSKQGFILLICLFFVSFVIIYSLSELGWAKIILAIITLVYGGSIFRRDILLKHPYSIVRLSKQKDDIWYLYNSKGHIEARLSGDSTVTTVCSILRFKVPNHFFKYSCLIFRDSINTETYRRLLLQL